MLFLSGSQILRGYIYNTVGIDVEGNLNLRNASSCRKNAVQTELAQRLVIPCKLTLALYYVDIYGSLVICSRREDLALGARNRCVSRNQDSGNAAQSLDRQ